MDQELKNTLAELNRTLEKLEAAQSKKKDFWDRAPVIVSFVSSVVVAGLVGWWTYAAKLSDQEMDAIKLQATTFQNAYDLRIKDLAQRTDQIDKEQRRQTYNLEVLERFVPHVAADKKRRQVALIALDELGQKHVAERFSELYKDEDTRAAVDQIQAQGKSLEQKVQPVQAKSGPPQVGKTTKDGWVYLGYFDGKAWTSRYLDFTQSQAPDQLSGKTYQVRAETGALNVRSGSPGLFGALKNVTAVLSPGSSVRLIGKPETTLSGYVWHAAQYSTE